MSLVIPDKVLQAARMTEEEMMLELAVLLFQKGKISLGQAAELAGMSYLQFQMLLASRRIPIHYDIAEFEQDMRTLQELRGVESRQ